jgi:hypothetical protein
MLLQLPRYRSLLPAAYVLNVIKKRWAKAVYKNGSKTFLRLHFPFFILKNKEKQRIRKGL